jgi:phenylpropionate dioxygenase-like ring-hydroxylating dioxygenase large terminal subunit
MRGKDGQIRGFHNTCSHRGNKVIVETGEETFGRNKAAVVTCRFHGWVYNANGKIVQVPGEQVPRRLRQGQERPHPGAYRRVGRLHLRQSRPGREGRAAGRIPRRHRHPPAGFPYGELSQCFSYHTYLDCNWKVAHDAFAEAYHVATIHAGSFPNVFSSGLQNVELFGPHRTTAICLSLDAEPTPVAKIANASPPARWSPSAAPRCCRRR